MTTLIVFPTPANAACVLKTDRGDVIAGHPAVHPTGRQGIGFDIPDGHPNGNGANLRITASGFVPIDQRGILWLNRPSVEFVADDFTLTKASASLPPLRTQGPAFVQEV